MRWQNARLATAGIGLGGAWLAARARQAKLTGIDASQAWPYIPVAVGVLAIMQLASFLRAQHAAKLDVQFVRGGA